MAGYPCLWLIRPVGNELRENHGGYGTVPRFKPGQRSLCLFPPALEMEL